MPRCPGPLPARSFGWVFGPQKAVRLRCGAVRCGVMKTSGGDLVSLGRTQPAPFAPDRPCCPAVCLQTLLAAHHTQYRPYTLQDTHVAPSGSVVAYGRMTLLGTNKRGSSVYTVRRASGERNVQPWEPFGNFAGRVSVRGAPHPRPSHGTGNPTYSSPYPLASVVPKFATPSHPI